MIFRFCSIVLAIALAASCAAAQASPASLQDRISAVISRPEFSHAHFGIEFYSLQSGKVLYSLNPNDLFTPASTTKIFTEGTLLAKLGPDYRFRTRVYRTGEVDKHGRLKGDLVLVASGDPNLSNRIRPNDKLAWNDLDHIYDGPAVAGDPLGPIKELVQQVAASGIREVDGSVLIDTAGYREEREHGSGIVVSSIVVNDNLIDLVIKPGTKAGDPILLETSPKTSYVTFVNHGVTTAAGTKPVFREPAINTNPNGTIVATFGGSLPADFRTITTGFAVPSPTNFARTVFIEALQAANVRVTKSSETSAPNFAELAASYVLQNKVAEHVSPPLSEDIKLTLKVSHNVHANLGPYLLGRLVANDTKDPIRAGFAVERAFLTSAGLDLSGASQSDGAGGDAGDFFSPDFACKYLTYLSTRPDFHWFFDSLPILGKDGTLSDLLQNSPAAGHVFAKTGTIRSPNRLNEDTMLRGKGLVGYVDTASGERLVFAAYVNEVALSPDPDSAEQIAGKALAEIAAATYDAPVENAYDLIIRNGRIVDGTGNPWYRADVGIRGDRVAAIGNLHAATAKQEIDATDRIVSPGFIDMLGHSEINLLLDNRALSKLSQGITTEITGERVTVSPQTEQTISAMKPFLQQTHLNVDWTTLDGYFRKLEKQGTTLNIGTYVGSAQLRQVVIGFDDRPATPAELDRMRELLAEGMKDGAMGVSSALIYPPNSYASTDELVALAKVASEYGGIYASHIRGEGATETEAIAEAIRIGKEAKIPVEIFHLKVAGKSRWGSMKNVITTIQSARDSGLDVAADMYPYTAGATALVHALPPWVADGGRTKLLDRLHDPAARARIRKELAADFPNGENLYLESGGASGVLISSVEDPELKQFEGKRLADVASAWKKSPEDALMDFVIADGGRTGAIYFVSDEDDMKLGLRQPWTSIGLDYGEMAADGPNFEPHPHPRAWGAVPRLLGKYVRDEHFLPMEAAIRKLSSLPAEREHLDHRGLLRAGFFADIAIFDPATITDRATFTEPTLLSRGIDYTIVNGKVEYSHGTLTGIAAGQVLRGRGWHNTQAD